MGVVYMFIGRERELASLNNLYNSGKFEFVVLYGRRRVGKTALINRFIDGKQAIYYMGVESNAKQNLENLSKCILESFNALLQAGLRGAYHPGHRRVSLRCAGLQEPCLHAADAD